MKNHLAIVKTESEELYDFIEELHGDSPDELIDYFKKFIEEHREEIEKDESDNFAELIKEITGG